MINNLVKRFGNFSKNFLIERIIFYKKKISLNFSFFSNLFLFKNFYLNNPKIDEQNYNKSKVVNTIKFFEGNQDNNLYFQSVYDSLTDLRNSFEYYKELIQILDDNKNLRVLPLYEIDQINDPKKNIIGLRHDIDNLPRTAVKASRYLARVGIPGSFYFLHTSPYYASKQDNLIVRNPELKYWIKNIAINGNEVGIHNDAFGVSCNWGLDGIEILKKEIEWIRSLGIPIRGTVAHNSAPIYGAENYEIFKEYELFANYNLKIEKRLDKQLGKLSLEELNLSYEGTFSRPKKFININSVKNFITNLNDANIHSEDWFYKWVYDNPSCDFKIGAQCWLLGKDSWAIASYINGYKTFRWKANINELKKWLYNIPLGHKIIFVLHPEYICGNSYD